MDKWLSFFFGIVFLSVMLVFAVAFPNPSQFQLRVFITVLALSAGGVGAVLPGYFEIRRKNLWRAGGAIALAGVVYFVHPVIEREVPRFERPQSPPEPIADKYLGLIDAGNYQLAWDMLSAEGRGVVGNDRERFLTVYANQRTPMGRTLKRILVGTHNLDSPSGYPVGLYILLTYQTKFEKFGNHCWTETVALRASQELEWRMFSHALMHEVPCLPS